MPRTTSLQVLATLCVARAAGQAAAVLQAGPAQGASAAPPADASAPAPTSPPLPQCLWARDNYGIPRRMDCEVVEAKNSPAAARATAPAPAPAPAAASPPPATPAHPAGGAASLPPDVPLHAAKQCSFDMERPLPAEGCRGLKIDQCLSSPLALDGSMYSVSKVNYDGLEAVAAADSGVDLASANGAVFSVSCAPDATATSPAVPVWMWGTAHYNGTLTYQALCNNGTWLGLEVDADLGTVATGRVPLPALVQADAQTTRTSDISSGRRLLGRLLRGQAGRSAASATAGAAKTVPSDAADAPRLMCFTKNQVKSLKRLIHFMNVAAPGHAQTVKAGFAFKDSAAVGRLERFEHGVLWGKKLVDAATQSGVLPEFERMEAVIGTLKAERFAPSGEPWTAQACEHLERLSSSGRVKSARMRCAYIEQRERVGWDFVKAQSVDVVRFGCQCRSSLPQNCFGKADGVWRKMGFDALEEKVVTSGSSSQCWYWSNAQFPEFGYLGTAGLE